jgi:signal transduction histidine kinase
MASGSDDRSWNVVVLSGANFPVPAGLVQDQALREAIIAGTTRRIEFLLEALEMFRLPRAESEPELVGFLRKKYHDVKVDLVLAVGDYGLDFAERHGAALWPGTPVVFYSVSEELVRNRNLRLAITGQTVCFEVGGTLDLAVRLQPNTKRIVVITGVTDNDRYWSIPVTEALRRHEGKLEVTWLTNQSVPHLVEAVRKLPRDTIVLYTTLFRDASGQTYVSRDVLRDLAAASSAPVYGFFETYVGQGVVGGCVTSLEEQGRSAARMALRVLAGESPGSIPVQPSPPSVPMADCRQLQRWGISEQRLPPDCVVQFRVPSFWELYHWHIVAGAGVIASQTALIVALLVQRRRRFWAEMQAKLERTELAHASRLATVGELTASITHEINQPLGAILRNAETAELLLQSASPDLDELRAIVADIRADNHRAGEVIDRLRSLLKRHRLETKTLAVANLVDDVIALLRFDAIARRVRLETSTPGELPPVRGDRVHLQQVLLNLILNGMDAVKDAADEHRCVMIRARVDGDGMIELAVSDAGHGISPENLKHLFEPFFTTKANGMGMGLSVSRNLIEAHGGRLWAENNAVRGATFRFTLPVSCEGQAASSKVPMQRGVTRHLPLATHFDL